MLGVMSGLLLFSIGSASYPLSQAILSDISMGIYKFKYFAWQAIALMSMMAVAEWSVSLLTLSWQLPLAFSICCEFACVLLGMVFLSESKKNNVADDDESDKTVVDLCALFFRRDLLITLLVYLLLMFAWGIVMQHGYSYLLNLFGSSRDTVLFSLLQSFLMIVSLLLIPFIIRKSQAFGKALKIIISVAIISLFCLWLPVAHIISGTFILLSGISFVLVAVILWSVFSDYAPMQYQGVMMCILGPLWSISWTYSGMVTTVIGNYFLCGPYLLAAILSLIALGLLSCQKYCFLK